MELTVLVLKIDRFVKFKNRIKVPIFYKIKLGQTQNLKIPKLR